jgi:hypothetical protein
MMLVLNSASMQTLFVNCQLYHKSFERVEENAQDNIDAQSNQEKRALSFRSGEIAFRSSFGVNGSEKKDQDDFEKEF